MNDLKDEWLEEMFFVCTLRPQILRLSTEAEEFGTLTRGMKVVLLGGSINRKSPTYTDYTIVMNCLAFKNYNIELTRQWYINQDSEYKFNDCLEDYTKQLGHRRYGNGMYDDGKYRSIFDKRFKPIPYIAPEEDKQ